MNAHIDRFRDHARRLLQRVTRVTPTQRVTLLVAVGLVAVVTIWWFQVERRATEVFLPGQKLNSAKRSELLKAFANAQLTGARIVEHEIHVPRGKSQEYMAALPTNLRLKESLSYHRKEASQVSRPFELSSEAARRQDLAAVRDLENTICEFKGVEDVFIQFDEAIENGLKPKRIIKGVVAVVGDGKTRLGRNTIDSIRRIVVSSRAGMKLSDVMVVNVDDGTSVGGPGSDDSHVQSLEAAMQVQEEIERHWQDKIREVLRFVPESQVVVTTPTPKLDPSQPSRLEMQTDRQISISVSVPMSYHLRRLKNSRGLEQKTLHQAQGETEQQIRQAIHGLIKAEYAQVVVTTFDDLPANGVASTNGWIARLRGRNWTAGVALLIAAVGVLTVHITSRKSKSHVDEPAATLSMAEDTVDFSDSDMALDQDDSELRATLTNRIQNDPDQAVRVLNQWLSRAG